MAAALALLGRAGQYRYFFDRLQNGLRQRGDDNEVQVHRAEFSRVGQPSRLYSSG